MALFSFVTPGKSNSTYYGRVLRHLNAPRGESYGDLKNLVRLIFLKKSVCQLVSRLEHGRNFREPQTLQDSKLLSRPRLLHNLLKFVKDFR